MSIQSSIKNLESQIQNIFIVLNTQINELTVRLIETEKTIEDLTKENYELRQQIKKHTR